MSQSELPPMFLNDIQYLKISQKYVAEDDQKKYLDYLNELTQFYQDFVTTRDKISRKMMDLYTLLKPDE